MGNVCDLINSQRPKAVAINSRRGIPFHAAGGRLSKRYLIVWRIAGSYSSRHVTYEWREVLSDASDT